MQTQDTPTAPSADRTSGRRQRTGRKHVKHINAEDCAQVGHIRMSQRSRRSPATAAHGLRPRSATRASAHYRRTCRMHGSGDSEATTRWRRAPAAPESAAGRDKMWAGGWRVVSAALGPTERTAAVNPLCLRGCRSSAHRIHICSQANR